MKFVVTAGPTREAIDPVRFLSNRSSGKMGYAIAAAARTDGHEVTLISGPVCLAAPADVQLISVTSAEEMERAVHLFLERADVLVMCAAVADYRAAQVATEKIKKSGENISLLLMPTRDILRSLPAERTFLVVGFAAETENLFANARAKLAQKNCDIVIANDVSDPTIGMESEENAVTIFRRDAEIESLPRAPKREIARELVKIFSREQQKSFDKKMLQMNDSKK